MVRLLLLSCLLLWVFSACSDKNIDTPTPSTEPGEEVALTFSVQLPSQGTTNPTYAMDEIAEHTVETVDVLAFVYNVSDQKYYFSYRSKGTEIEDVGSVDKKTFKVSVLKKDTLQRFVVLANATDEIDALGYIDKAGVKDEVLKRIIYKNNNSWKASNPGEFDAIPMWGESIDYTIDDATTEVGVVQLVRMVARIDVIAADSVQNDFKLKEVLLYNRKTAGHVVPNTTIWDESNNRVIIPTIPTLSNPTELTIKGPLKYETATVDNIAFSREIYTFEADSILDDTKRSDATCLVIGGIYGNDDKVTYYRVDFVRNDEEGNFLSYRPILRNHIYRVNIVKVTGSGYEDEEDAFNSRSINMKAEIVEWNELENMVYDNQYFLSVNPAEFYLYKEPQEDIAIKVYTDYPGGWEATREDAYSWITLQSNSGSPYVRSTLKFNVAENNESEPERTGYIRIKAGRMAFTVKVVQSNDYGFSLMITDVNNVEISELIFPSTSSRTFAQMEQDFNVYWSPTGADCHVTEVDLLPQFTYDNGVNPVNLSPLAGGVYNFTIQPHEMTNSDWENDPFPEKMKRLDFTVSNGSSYKMQSLFLRQIHYDVIPEPAASYVMDGSEYTFKVKSNAHWTASVLEDEDNIIKEIKTTETTGINKTPGEDFTFIIEDKMGSSTSIATAKIVYKNDERKYPDVVAVINGVTAEETNETANCYILKPSGMALSFPVSRANEDGVVTRIETTDEITAELLWTDHPSGMSSSGAVASVGVSGTGSSGRIIVVPGSSSGNAVVAVKVNNTICWSWHIWVTDYDPNTDTNYTNTYYTWMDRNLGAVTDSPGDINAFGLMYQWGRKDPYPGAAGITTNSARKIYNANGDDVSISGGTATSSNNLEIAIQNPMIMYRASNNDWYSSSSNQANEVVYLWNTSAGQKSVYDPCPSGWRVPYDKDYTSPFNDFNTDNAISVWDNNGRDIKTGYSNPYNPMGFWPAAGYIVGDGTNLTYTNVGVEGDYWSGYALGTNAEGRVMFFNQTNMQNSSTKFRSYGSSVRCVKDN